MISANANSLSAPYDTSELFWIAPAPSGPPLYSPTNFYFASADGSRLVSAMQDEQRFIGALNDAIDSHAGYGFVSGLQAIVNQLTADNTPPAPRYPQIGDTSVRGRVVEVFDAPAFIQLQSPTPPPDWQGPWAGPLWKGILLADLAPNGYDTPPAILEEAGTLGSQFVFQFSNPTAVSLGACTFDIVAGKSGAPMATNLQPA